MALGKYWEKRTSGIRYLLGIGLFLTTYTTVEGKDEHTKLATKFYDVKHCPDKKHHIRLSNVTFITGPEGGNCMNADARYNQRLPTISRIAVLLHKCSPDGDHCDYFTTWRWDREVCNMITTKGMAWTPIIDSIRPNVRCPVEARRDISVPHTGLKLARNYY